jgi:hypothetical protein
VGVGPWRHGSAGAARLCEFVNVKRAPVCCEIEGALWLAPVLIVPVARRWVGPMLRVGVGPSLERGMRCPACGGALGSSGSYRRRVRVSRVIFALR